MGVGDRYSVFPQFSRKTGVLFPIIGRGYQSTFRPTLLHENSAFMVTIYSVDESKVSMKV